MQQTSDEPQPNLPNGLRPWDWYVGIIPLIALLPMLVPYAVSLVDQPHMGFAPVVWIVVGLISLVQLKHEECMHGRRKMIATALFVICVVVYGFAVWNYSIWYAVNAAIGIFLAWALGRWSRFHWPTVMAFGCLLISTQVLPRNWDERYSTRLARQSGQLASTTLDGLQIPNLLDGGLLDFGTSQVTLRALNGFCSVYLLIALAIGIAIWRHRSLLHAALMVAASSAWIMVGFYGWILYHFYVGKDISIETLGQILTVQGTLLIFGVVCTLMWDQFLSSFLKPAPITDPELGNIFQVTNLCLVWPQELSELSVLGPEDDHHEYDEPILQNSDSEPVTPVLLDWYRTPQLKWTVLASTAFAVLFALPAALVLLRHPPALQASEQPLSNELLVQLPAEDKFADRFGQWELVEVTKQISEDGLHGEYRWKLRWGRERVDASLSFPVLGWPDESVLSSDAALQLTEQERMVGGLVGDWNAIAIQRVNSLGGKVYGCVSAMKNDLSPSTETNSGYRELVRSKFRSELTRILNNGSLEPPVGYLFRAECEAGEDLSDAQWEQFIQSFDQFRRTIRDQISPNLLPSAPTA